MKAKVELTGSFPALSFKVDGEPVYAKSVDIHADAESIPRVTVELDVLDPILAEVFGAEVCVGDLTRKSLLTLGWTPPEGTEDA